MIDANVLNTLQNHTIYAEDILNRLEGMGYTATMADVIILKFVSEKVVNHISNACNVFEVPEGLKQVCVDMISGDFLGEKNSLNQLDVEQFNIDDAIASVSMGDVSVSYDKSASPATKLQALIDGLKNAKAGDLVCYRKIKW